MAPASSSSSTAAPVAEPPPAPTSSTTEPPLPSAARPRRRCRVREVSSRYLSTPLPSPSPRLSTSSLHSYTPLPTAPSPRLSTSSLHSSTPLPAAPSPRLSTSSSQHSSTPSTRAHHHFMPAAAAASSGIADENRPPPTPGSRKRGAARDLFEEMHRPRLNPLAAAGVSGATATPGTRARRILRPSSRASPNVTTAARQHRKGSARPSTPARTSFSFYSASPQTSAAAFGSRAAAPCPLPVPFPELKTSPPGTTEEPGRPPNPFCFQALALALPDRRRAKIPASVVKPAPLPPAARKVLVVKKGSAVMGGSKAAGKQEDVHKLRLLDNCYMKFLNAQAEAVAISNKAVAEESLYGLSERIANLQKSVAQKKAELECLKMMEKVEFIVDAQVPSLEEWCELGSEHTSCLASGTVALRHAASRVPIRGNIKTNIGGVKSALKSAMETMKQLSPCAEKFLRKVGEIENVASELNSVVSNEQVLLPECADLLHQAHDMQAMEDFLRIQVMQLKNHSKTKHEGSDLVGQLTSIGLNGLAIIDVGVHIG